MLRISGENAINFTEDIRKILILQLQKRIFSAPCYSRRKMSLQVWLIAVIAVVGTFVLLRLVSSLTSARYSLRGKHCVITGGSMGIGKAVAQVKVIY